MKNIITEFRFSLSLIVGTFIIVIFTSYGNINVHPSINEMIVEAFLSKNQPKPQLPELKNYQFTLDIPLQSKGEAVIKSGLFHAEEIVWVTKKYSEKIHNSEGNYFDVAALYSTIEQGDAEHSVKEWIAHGGFAADEPEVPASLRHFYDPTQKPGERYLTNLTNARPLRGLQLLLPNPYTDGVEWALGKAGDLTSGVLGHNYTWEKGKDYMKRALEEKDKAKSSEWIGKAWRSLGETLHMIADNGCPSHVRNDAHPSPLWANNTWLGNPDPYEELVDYVRYYEGQEFQDWAKGAPNQKVTEQISTMTKVFDIAHALAVHTNRNFVTNETISGKNNYGVEKEQIINKENPCKAPLLDNMAYNDADYSYSYNGVKQCVDHYYFMKLIPKMCEPYVDMACVKSQAAVLIPTVIEAGAKVMELFIPKLKVEVLSAADSLVKGQVIHLTDPEYTSEIKYSGDITVLLNHIKTKKTEEITVKAKEGLFEAPGLVFEKGDIILARLEFSDQSIRIESDVFKISEEFYIGQKYGGGIIFYIDATGQHGLIAAPADQSTGAPWGCSISAKLGTKKALGSGKANTTAIVSVCSQAGSASRLCDDLVLNGYSDWFLPSIDELKQMHSNKSLISGLNAETFMTSKYWSSTLYLTKNGQYYPGLVFIKFTKFSGYVDNGSTTSGRVRAVRAF